MEKSVNITKAKKESETRKNGGVKVASVDCWPSSRREKRSSVTRSKRSPHKSSAVAYKKCRSGGYFCELFASATREKTSTVQESAKIGRSRWSRSPATTSKRRCGQCKRSSRKTRLQKEARRNLRRGEANELMIRRQAHPKVGNIKAEDSEVEARRISGKKEVIKGEQYQRKIYTCADHSIKKTRRRDRDRRSCLGRWLPMYANPAYKPISSVKREGIARSSNKLNSVGNSLGKKKRCQENKFSKVPITFRSQLKNNKICALQALGSDGVVGQYLSLIHI